jgi:tRNA pseudouridine38-40 synthase
MPAPKLALAINANLPADIRIMAARRCRADFHARFQAVGKQYRYFVWNHPSMNPLRRFQAWHVTRPLNIEPMRAAARVLVGPHDFASFANNRNYRMESTVRTVRRCAIAQRGPLWTFIIEADGFLYKMCRGFVGTLVQVGLGKIEAGKIIDILASKNRSAAGMTAPAHGLVLWKVFY